MPGDPLLERSERAIRSGRLLAPDGDLDGAASRLCYAMFYVAEALLETKGFSFTSHHAVLAAYGEHFAKTRELDPRFHRALLHAFQQRQLGDYSVIATVEPEVIETLAADATDFLQAAPEWLARR